MVQIYKFGGASVKDAAGIKNVCNIIKSGTKPLVVVISAMGKTTNAMEEIIEAYVAQNQEQLKLAYQAVIDYHNPIVVDLFGDQHPFFNIYNKLLNELWQRLQLRPTGRYDLDYDQIVPFGELISTHIVSAYANSIHIQNQWMDARNIIRTDKNYRNAEINWGLSAQLVRKSIDFQKQSIYITQGFIGATLSDMSTTLGREGSDYSGAVLAHILNAQSLTIWKDVPGVLNADPRWYPLAQKLNEISYPEAIELAYYGAQVIHPKTLKPLQNKDIPLYVKSFLDAGLSGTVIKSLKGAVDIPVYILKKEQLFITISPKDFSFIMEDNLSAIFAIFSQHKIKVNLMQNSALNFSVCINEPRDMGSLLKALQTDFTVRYNDHVELVTIRNYTPEAIALVTKQKQIIGTQLSRNTARYVLKESEWMF
ncbi:aspartate kinase [Saccharicrinis carchari]|uniref:Aspartokinase n=1 Tax=Saccharicrinis carchari TaxID=1168039 RepID=A0A521ETK5_SACCC|nr:aspartate kinase [Saccharicrinis carchari]SMO86420.1 aspartate kinase [Saccharicrinis carchari]